ncbi:hypothetical protein LTSESEN_4676 [Salmonella enterica subsp. enterica serovar Senftenberg str. A4-543]|uniref:Uncharacterized protein n=1 Tax=Salmonella enterica subsp. enterica serovar Senftenberg str. A4-543 TaxID=913082 RepID=G5R500_SALSE|nr:hypothetical protein LTSESEN_4676 [Salmonella enterica subsp. enterica serovar Senftenberg str. A4-543]
MMTPLRHFIHLFCGYSCEEVWNYHGKTQNSLNYSCGKQ